MDCLYWSFIMSDGKSSPKPNVKFLSSVQRFYFPERLHKYGRGRKNKSRKRTSTPGEKGGSDTPLGPFGHLIQMTLNRASVWSYSLHLTLPVSQAKSQGKKCILPISDLQRLLASVQF